METTVHTLHAPTQGEGGQDGRSLYRSPPANIEAEQALLAALLANNSAMEKVGEFLLADHFADRAHAKIFEACRKLVERGQVANAVTLKNYFEQDGDLADVGGAQYLAELQASYVTIINAEHYGREIHDLYLRRELIHLGEETVNGAYEFDLDQPATTQIEVAEQRLYSLAETGQSDGGFKEFRSALQTAIEQAEAAHKRDGQLAGVATGLIDFDELLGGLHSSDLIILAGRPGMGKTALATNIGFNAAKHWLETNGESGATVGFFSLEMSAEQLATRILSEQSGVPGENIRRGRLQREDFDRVVQASAELSALPFYIDDTPAVSVGQMRTRCRRLKRQHNLGLIIVDYIQLMRPTSGGRAPENRVQEISEITRGLKIIAKELNVPVIALSQLSRAVEQREDKRPQLADLRESGSIEQDADVVLFVYREQYYLEKAEPSRRPDESEEKFQQRHASWQERLQACYGLAETIIAKQRHGPTGRVKLSFDGATTRFGNYVPDDHLPDVR